MNNKAFVFSGLAFLLVVPVVILAASFTSMLSTGTTGVVTHLRGDKVFGLFEVTEKDLDRVAAISGRRAAVTALDYIETWNETLDSYNSAFGTGTCGALREMMMAGTLTGASNPYDPSGIMTNNTLPNWVTNIKSSSNAAGFNFDVSPFTVADVGCKCVNNTYFTVSLTLKGSVSDETGNFVYNGTFPRSGNATALVSGEGTSAELFPNCANEPPTAIILAPIAGNRTFTDIDLIEFIGNGSDSDGDYPLNFSWSSDIDGPLAANVKNFTTTLSAGTHTITLTVTDSRGAKGSDSIQVDVSVFVNTPPVAVMSSPNSTANNFTQGDTIIFNGTASYDPDGDPLTYQWEIDSVVVSLLPFFNDSTVSVGNHTVTLTVFDPFLASNSTTMNFTVNPPSGGPVSITLSPTDDTYIRRSRPNNNYGGAELVVIRHRSSGSNTRRGLFRFDLSTIPSTATINSAVLLLYVESRGGGGNWNNEDILVHRVTSSWSESTVTWNSLPSTAFDATIITQQTPLLPGNTMSFTLTSSVQDFVAGTYPNYGWMLKYNNDLANPNMVTRFASDENSIPSPRPILNVTYTP